jgi:hypothetical protein
MSRARNTTPTPPGMAGYKPTLLGTVPAKERGLIARHSEARLGAIPSEEGGLIARHGWAAEVRENQCIARGARATPREIEPMLPLSPAQPHRGGERVANGRVRGALAKHWSTR